MVGRRNEETIHVIADRLGNAAHARGNDRHACGHRFQQCDALRLAERGEDREIEGLRHRHHIGPSPGEAHVLVSRRRQGGCLRTEDRPKRAIPHQHEPGVG